MNKMKTFLKLGFDSEETKILVDKLDLLLCNLQVHYQKLRSYHWNVTGSEFFELHEVFEEEYNDVKVEIDEIAERIRVFGKVPASTLQEYLDKAEIKETSPQLSSMEMVREILDDFETLLEFMIDVAEASAEAGDLSTSDQITGYLKRTEKKHWMLTAYSKEAVVA